MTAGDRRRIDRTRLATRIAIALLAVGTLHAAARRLGDFDLPWHLAVGRAAVVTRGRVARDDFSYTFQGRPTPQEYLSDVTLYLAERAGGAAGLHLVGGLAIALLVALLVARARDALPGAVATAALALAAGAPWLTVRPALLSLPCLALELHLIDRHRREGRAATLAWTIPLQLVWANCHGFAVVGALVLCGYGGYAALCRAAGGRVGALLPAREGRGLGVTLAVVLAAAAATAASSHGLAIFAGPFVARSHSGLVTEWAPTTLAFVRDEVPVYGVLALAALAALVFGRDPERRPSAYDVGLSVGFFFLSLSAVRLIPLFAVAVAPIVARRLWPIVASARGVPALIVACALGPSSSLLLSRVVRFGFGWDQRALPVAAVRFLEAERPQGPPFNRLGFGGYLIWRLYPEVRVFVDGRTGWLYPFDFVVEYQRALHDGRRFEALRERYRFEWAIVGAGADDRSCGALTNDARWAMVYLDDTAAVYVWKDGPNRDLALRGYRVIHHQTAPEELLFRPPATADLAHDAELAVTQAPRSSRARGFAVALALARHDPAAVAVARQSLAEIDPDDPLLVALDRIAPGALSTP